MILLLKPALFRAVLDGIGIDTTEGSIGATASSDPS
jgi:hypothetical protein